jgi:hypothetical protein
MERLRSFPDIGREELIEYFTLNVATACLPGCDGPWSGSVANPLAIEKLQYLRGIGAHVLDLSMPPRVRRRFLATLGRRSTVQGLQGCRPGSVGATAVGRGGG